MKFIYIHVGVLLYSIVFAFGNEKPTLEVFYESNCPQSVEFMVHLEEAWTKYKGKFSLDLIPFGNAEQLYVHGGWIFECQHYQQECSNNKLHACAIHQQCGEGGTVHCGSLDNISELLHYINCIMLSPNHLEASPQCARAMNHDKIVQCARGPEGDELLSHYGNRTLALNQEISVPYVTVDGKEDKEAEKNLTQKLEILLEPSAPNTT